MLNVLIQTILWNQVNLIENAKKGLPFRKMEIIDIIFCIKGFQLVRCHKANFYSYSIRKLIQE